MPSQSTRAKVSPSQIPKKVLIIDDFLQWSNLAYLTVSRVERPHQLERVVCPPEEGSEVGPLTELDEPSLRKTTIKKLVAYKRQDQDKGLMFNLKVNHILRLKEAQNNNCVACDIQLLWAYQPKDTQQFSVDRLDNSKRHVRDNIRLTCLECNRKRGAAALSAWEPHPAVVRCLGAQRGAPHARSPAEDYLPNSRPPAHRAWSPSVRADTPQETTLSVAPRRPPSSSPGWYR